VTELYGAEPNDVAAFIGLAVELSPLAGSHRPDLNPSLPHSLPRLMMVGLRSFMTMEVPNDRLFVTKLL